MWVFDSQLISPSLSAKILNEALEQQREILEEAEKNDEAKLQTLPRLSIESVQPSVSSDDEDEIDKFQGFSETQSFYDGEEVSLQFFSYRIVPILHRYLFFFS